MTIVYTMVLVGLLGLTLHLQWYWAAGVIVAIYAFGRWWDSRAARRPPDR